MEKGPWGRGPPYGTEVRKMLVLLLYPFEFPGYILRLRSQEWLLAKSSIWGLYVGMNPEFGKALALLESE